ncbi:hypothetical protein SteCoe_396 [Stentor coeruleus]|uniref:RING-type domain-containing protein n=1 Tax=Stentor coeruleus TaxID=5963 RepID=A0A1R2D479_9CILI|nr:hypothetical protein SteCoe_396 [Stentor coeruleus]
MEETSPLAPRNESQQQVRRNLFRTIEHKIYTSYLLITFTTLLTFTKIISAVYILTYQEDDSGAPLFLWNIVNVVLDMIYLILKAFRMPYVKRAREGEEVEEFYVLQIMFIIQIACYVLWQIPGNVWYWRCSECFDNAPALTALTLANLILGYLYMLGPALLIVSICACLPVAIIFVMMISGSSQLPATDDMVNSLQSEGYDPQKHMGDTNCTICAVEYSLGEKITVMQCDPRHFFHNDCIKKWLKINANCPICRAPYLLD